MTGQGVPWSPTDPPSSAQVTETLHASPCFPTGQPDAAAGTQLPSEPPRSNPHRQNGKNVTSRPISQKVPKLHLEATKPFQMKVFGNGFGP